MNCFNHPDRPAVIQCKECGKGFCHEEAVLFKNGLCPDCQKKMLDEQLHRQQLLIQQEEEQRRQLEEQRAAEQKATYEEERAWYLKVFKYSMYVGIPLTIVLLVIFIGEDKGGFLLIYQIKSTTEQGLWSITTKLPSGPPEGRPRLQTKKEAGPSEPASSRLCSPAKKGTYSDCQLIYSGLSRSLRLPA